MELLYFYDPAFRSGEYKLYPWQIEVLQRFGDDRPIDLGLLHQTCVVAANGSGKSQLILAPCIAWIPMTYDYGFSYVTSSSALQLDTQTERFLDYLIDKVNSFHYKDFNVNVWDRVKRKKHFFPTDGYVDLLATDESGKAEGKHPLRGNSEFAIFVDEAKTVTGEIFNALARCNGWSRKIYVSSPGGHSGEFYQVATTPELGWWTRKVTYKDCPHIREEEVKNAILKHGLHDPLVRSMYFAEFTADDATIVISKLLFENCVRYFTTERKDGYNRMGLDVSAGGDESVCSIWDGNVMVAQYTFRYSMTNLLVDEVIKICQKHEILAKNVWIDDGGIGRGVYGNFVDRGWDFNRVGFGSSPIDKTRYLNRGTELWFNFKQFVENNSIKIFDDSILRSQLTNRYFRVSPVTSKLMLEPKSEAKAKGHPSPDRADACVLAWADRIFDDELVKIRRPIIKEKKLDLEGLENMVDDLAYGKIKRGPRNIKPAFVNNRSAIIVAKEKLKTEFI